MTETPEHEAYCAARGRCNNPKNGKFKDYGGRGIKFLFTSFEQFYKELGPRPEGMSLDRIEVNGNYEPGNVRWAPLSVQSKNRRPFHFSEATITARTGRKQSPETTAKRVQVIKENGKRRGKSTSKYKGVSFSKCRGKWRADIQLNGRKMSLGYFAFEEDAARAYDAAARKYFGTGAYMNLSDDLAA